MIARGALVWMNSASSDPSERKKTPDGGPVNQALHF